MGLVGILGHDDREVRTAITHVLEPFGAAAVPQLLQALKDERWQVREHAADILGLIADEAAIPFLIDVLQDEQWQVRFAAVTALNVFEGEEVIIALRPLSNDPHQPVRALVDRTLTQRRTARSASYRERRKR